MQVLTCDQPGMFSWSDQEMPVPESGHLLLQVCRIGICGTDLHAFEGTQPYFDYPRVLGHELACIVVDANGSGQFQNGDQVTVIPYFHCGSCNACRKGKTNCCTSLKVYGVHVDGGMREYISLPGNALIKENQLTLDQLCLIEPLSIAYHGIRRAEVKKGDTVWVVGAGPIGLGLMLFARHAGALVIASDIHEDRLDFCAKHMDVPHILNASDPDLMGVLHTITEGQMPDVIIDATGSIHAIQDAFRFISHGGRYVLVGLQRNHISFSHPEFHKREASLQSSRNATRSDFEEVIGMIRKQEIHPEVLITHHHSIHEAAAQFPTYLQAPGQTVKVLLHW